MIFITERLEGHSLELRLEGRTLVLALRLDKFSDRTSMTYQTGDETVADLVNESFAVQQPLHVEQVARMLPIECGADLAAKKLAV